MRRRGRRKGSIQAKYHYLEDRKGRVGGGRRPEERRENGMRGKGEGERVDFRRHVYHLSTATVILITKHMEPAIL